MSLAIAVTEPSQVGHARREGAELTRALALDETHAGKAAIVITEIATNLVKHAGGGSILLRAVGEERAGGLQILGLDRGNGIPNVGDSLRDGYSTSGTSGTGLGAVRRLSSAFDIYTQPGTGTAVFAEVGLPRGAAAFEIGAVSIAMPGETVCGDGWAVIEDRGRATILLVDGLGHGMLAANASHEAIKSLGRTTGGPHARIEAIHGALKATRGAAVAVAEIDPARRVLCFAGIGNIAGAIITEATPARHLVSHNGIAGHDVRRIDEFSYPWPPDALLVIHSDGITTRWDLSKYPGLAARHPALIAGVLYRDFHRAHDDATVVVARARRGRA